VVGRKNARAIYGGKARQKHTRLGNSHCRGICLKQKERENRRSNTNRVSQRGITVFWRGNDGEAATEEGRGHSTEKGTEGTESGFCWKWKV
jgi:hypothetical protein